MRVLMADVYAPPPKSRQLILPYLQLDIKYFDLGLEHRDAVRRPNSHDVVSTCADMILLPPID